jgi:peptidoglycan/LPS O-acetylase OafA/YrhL
MGLLRTFLALLVVCDHVRPLHGHYVEIVEHGSVFAVKAFFIISGFYMTMVLHGQYRDRPVWNFYASRFTRLLPMYWFVGLATVIAELLLVPRGSFFYPPASPFAYGSGLEIHSQPWPVLLYVAVATTTMFGLDTGQWLGFSKITGDLGVAPDFVPNATSVMALSPVPQAWTVGIELFFYLLAPMIVTRSVRAIVTLAIASLAFRFALIYFDLYANPWNRALFPSELVYFLVGTLSYRFYLSRPRIVQRVTSTTAWTVAIAPIVASLFIIQVVDRSHTGLLATTIPYLLVAICLPFLFDLTKANSLDRRIGDLSYPIYMCHMLVMGILQQLVAPVGSLGTDWLWLVWNASLVCVGAVILDRAIAAPIDRWRQRFGARQTAIILSGELSRGRSAVTVPVVRGAWPALERQADKP